MIIQRNIRSLPNINLTTSEYRRIVKKKPFAKGGEGCLYLSSSGKSLYKFFYNRSHTHFIDFPENKLNKIIALYEMNPDYMIGVRSTISIGDFLVGYEMEYDVATIPFNQAMLSRDEKIFHLNEAKKALEYFAFRDIVYGDIKSNNILINYRTSQIQFCDVDNVQVLDYPMDLVVSHLEPFYKKYGRIDSVTDIYMHNILTLQQLEFGEPFPTMGNVMSMVEEGYLLEEFEPEADSIFESMRDIENFNGEYAIQYVKK